MKKSKELLFAAAFVLTAALLLGLCGAALRPVRVDYGAVWEPYLAEPKDSLDYLYLGSSYAYCDVNPSLIYDATGLTGYVLAGPEQTLSTTYWYLREALKTQTPQVVLIEASALHFERYQNYSQINVGYMPFSTNKLHAFFEAAEPELRTGLLFDLYFYHSRWKELTVQSALWALAPKGADQLKGYTAVEGVFEQIADGPFQREVKPDAVYRQNLADLGRILALCEEYGALPVVVFHPTYSQLPAQEYERIRSDVAALDPKAKYFDWSSQITSIGLDPTLHFFDPGHLNRAGADLFSPWVGIFLTNELEVFPRAQTEENAAAWRASAEHWLQAVPSEQE